MTAQNRFFELLAIKPYCSDSKGAHDIRTKQHAIKRAYIQANPPHLCAWLIFDCDHTNIEAFKDAGLPPPNWICITPGKGTYHLAYAIDPVYTTENARPHPLRYLAAIQRTYTVLLGADPSYSGLITKNPLHESWGTWWQHNHVYTLGELADYVNLLPATKDIVAEQSNGYGRNCDLFDLTRKWSYLEIREANYRTHNQFYAAILTQAKEFNSHFKTPLDYVEVSSISRSVAKFTWRHKEDIRSRKHKQIRKIGLNEDLPLQTKQALGAMYTHSVQNNATQGKIKAARAMLMAKGSKASQSAVQAVTGLGIATIKRHWKDTAPTG